MTKQYNIRNTMTPTWMFVWRHHIVWIIVFLVLTIGWQWGITVTASLVGHLDHSLGDMWFKVGDMDVYAPWAGTLYVLSVPQNQIIGPVWLTRACGWVFILSGILIAAYAATKIRSLPPWPKFGDWLGYGYNHGLGGKSGKARANITTKSGSSGVMLGYDNGGRWFSSPRFVHDQAGSHRLILGQGDACQNAFMAAVASFDGAVLVVSEKPLPIASMANGDLIHVASNGRGTHCNNPMLLIRRGPHAWSDAQILASHLIRYESAWNLAAALMLWALHCLPRTQRTLCGLAGELHNPAIIFTQMDGWCAALSSREAPWKRDLTKCLDEWRGRPGIFTQLMAQVRSALRYATNGWGATPSSTSANLTDIAIGGPRFAHLEIGASEPGRYNSYANMIFAGAIWALNARPTLDTRARVKRRKVLLAIYDPDQTLVLISLPFHLPRVKAANIDLVYATQCINRGDRGFGLKHLGLSNENDLRAFFDTIIQAGPVQHPSVTRFLACPKHKEQAFALLKPNEVAIRTRGHRPFRLTGSGPQLDAMSKPDIYPAPPPTNDWSAPQAPMQLGRNLPTPKPPPAPLPALPVPQPRAQVSLRSRHDAVWDDELPYEDKRNIKIIPPEKSPKRIVPRHSQSQHYSQTSPHSDLSSATAKLRRALSRRSDLPALTTKKY